MKQQKLQRCRSSTLLIVCIFGLNLVVRTKAQHNQQYHQQESIGQYAQSGGNQHMPVQHGGNQHMHGQQGGNQYMHGQQGGNQHMHGQQGGNQHMHGQQGGNQHMHGQQGGNQHMHGQQGGNQHMHGQQGGNQYMHEQQGGNQYPQSQPGGIEFSQTQSVGIEYAHTQSHGNEFPHAQSQSGGIVIPHTQSGGIEHPHEQQGVIDSPVERGDIPYHEQIHDQQQHQSNEVGDTQVSAGNDVASVVPIEVGGSSVWDEMISVGSTAWYNGWELASEMFVQLGIFQVLLIPAILLTGIFMLWVAYDSPYNAQSHYLVDAIPGHGGYGGHGGYYGANKWRRSFKSYTAQKIEELTPKILDAINEFLDKH